MTVSTVVVSCVLVVLAARLPQQGGHAVHAFDQLVGLALDGAVLDVEQLLARRHEAVETHQGHAVDRGFELQELVEQALAAHLASQVGAQHRLELEDEPDGVPAGEVLHRADAHELLDRLTERLTERLVVPAIEQVGEDRAGGVVDGLADRVVEAVGRAGQEALGTRMISVDDPLGMVLKIGRPSFQVIGVLADQQFRSHTRKALAIDDRSQEVYIPYSSSMRTFGTVTYFQKTGSREISEVELDQIIVQAESSDKVLPTSLMTAAMLKNFHEKKDYEIVVPLELLQQSEETQQIFNVVMVLIASISLVVGGIGIANIMLATITERTREIGIRRALGAQRKDIMIQFLTETVAIAAVGGLLGALFGVVAILGIVEFTQWKALIEPHYIIISLGISCTVGILFGIFPARRAAFMDPIAALRHE